MAVNASQRGTGGGPNTGVPLSTFEETVAQILGRDVGPLQNVAQNHFVNNEVSSIIFLNVHIRHDLWFMKSNIYCTALYIH